MLTFVQLAEGKKVVGKKTIHGNVDILMAMPMYSSVANYSLFILLTTRWWYTIKDNMNPPASLFILCSAARGRHIHAVKIRFMM